MRMPSASALFIVFLASLANTAAAQAQAPQRGAQPERGAQPQRGAPPASPAAPATSQPAERGAAPDGYKYDPAGRRDPFRDLLAPGPESPLAPPKVVEGPAGLSVNEITVRGILQSRTGFIAMIQAPDKKTYLVHQGDKFLDGIVRSVTPQGLVIVQEVRDPLSLVKQREIRKLLRSAEGAKP